MERMAGREGKPTETHGRGDGRVPSKHLSSRFWRFMENGRFGQRSKHIAGPTQFQLGARQQIGRSARRCDDPAWPSGVRSHALLRPGDPENK
jgi:hypothetical protein